FCRLTDTGHAHEVGPVILHVRTDVDHHEITRLDDALEWLDIDHAVLFSSRTDHDEPRRLVSLLHEVCHDDGAQFGLFHPWLESRKSYLECVICGPAGFTKCVDFEG